MDYSFLENLTFTLGIILNFVSGILFILGLKSNDICIAASVTFFITNAIISILILIFTVSSKYEELFEEKNFLRSIVKILLPLTTVLGLIVLITLSFILDYVILFFVSIILLILLIIIFFIYLIF